MNILSILTCLVLLGCYNVEDTTSANTIGNPIIPGYFADPSIFMDDDSTFYIYSTTDGYDTGKFTNGPLGVWKSTDFKNWEFFNFDYPNNFPYVSDRHWAPSVTKGANGKYYMYFVKDGYDCFVVSSKSPTGPWNEENGGKPVYEDMFDAEAFKDDDGSVYLIYQGPKKDGKYSIWLGKLKPNMIEFETEPRMIYQNFDLFEGPGMFKRDGKYYLLYSNGGLSGTYHVNAAYGDESIWGPYEPHNTKGGEYNPVINPIPEQNMISTGHNSVLKIDTSFYMIYHRKAYPYRKGSDLWRQIAIEKLKFEDGGRLKSILPTFEGTNPLGGFLKLSNNLALNAEVTASSTKDSMFISGFITDENYGTMWKAGDNSYPQILELDFGRTTSLNEIRIFFEYATESYQYKIEKSANGKNWSLLKDRTTNKMLGCPVVHRQQIKTRHLKITITGSDKKNQAAGIWEIVCN